MTEKIVVFCEAKMGGRHEYADAVGWEVDDRGGLRILGGGANAIAAFPEGRWLRVERKSESA